MLMDHKNLRFTPIPDKTNDFIFLKSHHVLGDVSGHFCPRGFFRKNPVLSHTIIYGPLTPCQVSQKTKEPIPRKLMDRRKDRQTEGRTNRPYSLGPFQLWQRTHKISFSLLHMKQFCSIIG